MSVSEVSTNEATMGEAMGEATASDLPVMEIKARSYKSGDQVVLPPYGVGVVKGTITREIVGVKNKYYEVDFPNGTSKAFVPVKAPHEAGLRPALGKAEVDEVLECLHNGELALPKQWAARHRRVTEILASGDPFQIATLASELRRWDQERGLPDLDRQAYGRALRLLDGEISAVLGISQKEARALMKTDEEESVLQN